MTKYFLWRSFKFNMYHHVAFEVNLSGIRKPIMHLNMCIYLMHLWWIFLHLYDRINIRRICLCSGVESRSLAFTKGIMVRLTMIIQANKYRNHPSVAKTEQESEWIFFWLVQQGNHAVYWQIAGGLICVVNYWSIIRWTMLFVSESHSWIISQV